MEAVSPEIIQASSQEVSPAATATPALGREDFLALLIAQLENQDPLEPAKDTEFIAQLATFSSLEQLILANENLTGLAVGQSTLVNAQALNLIGKEALVEAGDEIRIVDGKPEELVYDIPRAAASATLTIYAPDGAAVREFPLGTTPAGRTALDWDGTDEEGNPLPDGDYRFEVRATDLDGEVMEIAVFRAMPIDGVSFDEQGIALISGDQEIPFESILEFRADRPQS